MGVCVDRDTVVFGPVQVVLCWGAFVCKIPLLARALGLKAERARDDRISCIQGVPGR